MKSRNIFYIYLITGSILFLNSCIAYKYSHKSKGEEVYVEIIHFSDENNSFPVNSVMEAKNKTRTRGVLPLIAAPYAINMAVRGVSKVVASERKKYAAVYSAKNSDDMFYTDNTSKAGINIEEIRFVRLVKGKKQKMDTALVLGLGAELSSDGNFIRLVPKRLDVSYSKTKLKLGDKKFDLDLNVTINAYWLDPNKQHNAKEVASLNIILYNIPIRGSINQNMLKNSTTQWFPIIPRSQLADNIYGTGNFLIQISANEYAEYGKRSQSASGAVNISTEDLFKMMKDVTKRQVKEYDERPKE